MEKGEIPEFDKRRKSIGKKGQAGGIKLGSVRKPYY